MADEKTAERPKRDLSILGKELGIPMKSNGSVTPPTSSIPGQNKPDENAKNTETAKANADAGKEAPPADPKDAVTDENKKSNEGKADDNKYQLGGKYVAKEEVVKELNEKFKNKYDFSKLDDESFGLYYEVLKQAKDGENKNHWQKSMGERENQIAAEKKKLADDIAEIEYREKEISAEKLKLKKLVSDDIDNDLDLTDDERLDKRVDQRLAKKELQDITRIEQQLKSESERLEALQNRLLFYEDHSALSKEYPELNTSIHIKDVFTKHAKKQEVDENDVRVAFAVFKIVNDAIEYGMSPVEYYRYYKDNYKLPTVRNNSTDKTNSVKTAEEINAEELKKRAEELKKKQDAAPGIPPGGKQVDPNPPQRGHVLPGKTEKQKLNFIYSGGKS